VNAAVETIAKAKPQAVVMVTLYKPTAAFVKAMKKAGQNPMFMTLSPVGTEQLIAELGPDARGIGISQVMPYPWSDVVPLVRDYQKLIGNKSGVSYYGIEAYAMARIMVDALRKAGKDPPVKNCWRRWKARTPTSADSVSPSAPPTAKVRVLSN